MSTSRVADIHESVATALEAAYQRGFEDGQKALREAFLVFASTRVGPAAPTFLGSGSLPSTSTTDAAEEEVRTRAPRGALDAVLNEVLAPGVRMTIDEVEAAVKERDSRVALKSVYNRLRHFEKTDGRFRRVRGRWQRREEQPYDPTALWDALDREQTEDAAV